jgi:actin beta/gamma 1
LTLFASSLGGGTIVDCGDGITSITPVWQGQTLPHTCEYMDLAGADITNQLLCYLHLPEQQRDVAELVKSTVCRVKVPSNEHANLFEEDPRMYTLPDGQTLAVKASHANAPDLLFRPGPVARRIPGLHEAIHASITKCDVDLRQELFGTIYLVCSPISLCGPVVLLTKQ